ncbi:MAG: type III-A CRISPR-associated RAMP protein Csm5 [Thermoplasmata archaeon]
MNNAEIVVNSPVFIGSGEQIDFKYLYRKGGTYRLIDFDKTADLILSGSRAQFYTERVIKNIKNQQRIWQDLWSDLEKEGLLFYYGNEIEEIGHDLGTQTTNIRMYIGSISQKGNETNLVPYIPGSTIKGSIRNAIFYRYIKQHGLDMRQENYETEFRNFFNLKMNNGEPLHLMKYIAVSDFLPVESDIRMAAGRIVRRKLATGYPMGKFQPAIFIKSGRFMGSIGINNDIFSQTAENRRGISERFSAMLGTDIFGTSPDIADQDQINTKLIGALLNLLEKFTRDVDSWYIKNFPGTAGTDRDVNIYLGFGKGINRNSVAIALPESTSKAVFRFRKGSYPPRTLSYVKYSDSEYRPLGMAKIRYVSKDG